MNTRKVFSYQYSKDRYVEDKNNMMEHIVLYLENSRIKV